MDSLGKVAIQPFGSSKKSLSVKVKAEVVALYVLLVITALLTAAIIIQKCREVRRAISTVPVLLVEALACFAIGGCRGSIQATYPWFATNSLCFIILILVRWR
jgi:hypothetical protein